MPDKSAMRRRLLLLGGAVGVVAAWNGVGMIPGLLPGRLDFEPLADPAGFRRLAGGVVSAGFDPLAAIASPNAEAPPVMDERVLRADLCGALFGGAPAPGVVPVASFSDYHCPYCRVLTQRLAEIEAETDGAARVSWHEWPLLGATSEMAARAALAAKAQGAYLAFHEALMGSGFVVTPALLAHLAERLALDPARLAADMESDATTTQIARSRGLARLFGFAGTPALVVGRTVVVGEINAATLRRLIDRERDDGPPPACASA